MRPESPAFFNMELSDAQKAAITSWVNDNQSIADIQNLLRQEFEISMTYMDVRFLVDDLEINFKEPEPEVEEVEEAGGANAAEAVEEPEVLGGVRVEVNPVTPPGALVAGTVTFSEGKQMQWQLSAAGQIGLLPGDDPNYRPGPEDVQEFQSRLQEVLQKQGY